MRWGGPRRGRMSIVVRLDGCENDREGVDAAGGNGNVRVTDGGWDADQRLPLPSAFGEHVNTET